jgi:tetraacyldisaccharide 4'-kinase
LTRLAASGYIFQAQNAGRRKALSISPEVWQAIVSGERRGLKAALWRRLLWAARLPYGIGVWGRNKLFDIGWKKVHRAAVPVVSVGNLTLGGTGKTPCVEYVAGFYSKHGFRVAILSRGYGAEGGRNDEAMLLEENLPDVPHLQDRDRVAIAATAVDELESEVLVLDDGFQHRRLARDLDIVLIDATNPWGFGYMFPRGALREPVGSLKRAHAVMITRADRVMPDELEAIKRRVCRVKELPISATVHAPVELLSEGKSAPVDELRGKPVAAFCGIGNPEAFRRTLEDLGAEVRDFRTYPDHHGYTREDVEELCRWADQQPVDAVMATTQKDFVKLRLAEMAGRPLWAVRIGLRFIEGQEVLDKLLTGVIGEKD